jgi:predicted glycoside hydrolase/deacetylase ChbG (UPF0249 family)
MPGQRYLIVNADDFGQSPGINRGIIQAHEHGIVTSASLMVRWPAAAEAAAYGREHPAFSIGLHLDLGEWIYREKSWTSLYQVVPIDDPDAVAEEVGRQLAAYRRLMGADPTHLDSHQHVHRDEPVHSFLIETAREMDVPLRHFCPPIRYCGNFYGQTAEGQFFPQGISVDALIRLLSQLPLGVTELGCHPGEEEALDSMYVHERVEEVRTLCDPRIRTALAVEGINLCSFRTYPTAL